MEVWRADKVHADERVGDAEFAMAAAMNRPTMDCHVEPWTDDTRHAFAMGMRLRYDSNKVERHRSLSKIERTAAKKEKEKQALAKKKGETSLGRAAGLDSGAASVAVRLSFRDGGLPSGAAAGVAAADVQNTVEIRFMVRDYRDPFITRYALAPP